MMKEVNPEQLKENLKDLINLGEHLQQLGEVLNNRASNIKDDVVTMASYVPAEGVDTCNIPIALFNALVSGLKDIYRLTMDERYEHSRRIPYIERIYKDLMTDLTPYLDHDPFEEPEKEEQEKLTYQEFRNRERMRKLLSDKPGWRWGGPER